MAQVGTPSLFTEAVAKLILKLAYEGKTDAEMADAVGVSRNTIIVWRRNNPEFAYTVREAKARADGKVVEALFQIATGFSRKRSVLTKDGNIAEIEDYYPPNVKAIQVWLYNRTKEWKDRSKASITPESTNVLEALAVAIAGRLVRGDTQTPDEQEKLNHRHAGAILDVESSNGDDKVNGNGH